MIGNSQKSEKWRSTKLLDGSFGGSGRNNNEIITGRYTCLTFLPKSILEQFRKKSNFFFLLMVIIQLTVPVPTNPSLYIFTFACILLVSICKSGYEDWLRHRADDQVNCQLVHLCTRQSTTVQKSKSLSIGHVIRLEDNEDVPADILLLAAVSPGGKFVQKTEITTANLDGEPTLKLRMCAMRFPPCKLHNSADLLETLFQNDLVVEYDQPNTDLYKFNGRLVFTQGRAMGRSQATATLTMDNILLRGTSVKHSKFVYGLVLYAGNETRLSLNTNAPRLGKFSLVDTAINRLITAMAVLLVLFVGIGVIGCIIWYRSTSSVGAWYLPEYKGSEALLGMTTSLLFVVLFSGVIPISLSVSVEIQKFTSSLFFGWDAALHSPDTGEAPLSNNSDVVEELGQIDYLLTDKTGTLTENNLNFVCCSIAGTKFDFVGHHLNPVATSADTKPKPSCDKKSNDEFFQALTLCHTVQAVTKHGVLRYHGMSTDEEVLVTAALSLGICFLGEDSEGRLILEQNGIQTKFRRHFIFEFDSERKCMSVIVEDPKGQFFLVCKGAESALITKCISTSAHLIHTACAHATDYAKKGLRTLMVGKREVSNAEMEAISHTVSQFHQDPLKLNAFYAEVETGLKLLGVTGVEDRLQEGVPETLKALRLAGIRTWMLTGDKMETALHIALNANIVQCRCASAAVQLCSPDEDGSFACIVDLTGITSLDKIVSRLQSVERKLLGGKSLSLIMDSTTFSTGFEHCRPLLTKVTMRSSQIVFCRMTPLQKAQVAKLAKGTGSSPFRVCAVGDGGNDVAMIQEAHVAIGILGKEGRQAARAADFAVPKFNQLQRAILIHGSWNYDRLVTLVNYFFYRAFLLVIPQVVYAFQSGFSGQPIFDSTFMMFYSLFFASMPVLLYASQERRYSAQELMSSPELYNNWRGNALMSWKWMSYYVCMIIWHSLLAMYLPTVIWRDELELMDYAVNSHMVNALVLIVTDLKLVMRTVTFTWIVLAGQVFSFGIMLSFYTVSSEVFASFSGSLLKYAYFPLLSNPGFWHLCILASVLTILPDLIGGALRRIDYRKRQRFLRNKPDSVILDDIDMSSRTTLV